MICSNCSDFCKLFYEVHMYSLLFSVEVYKFVMHELQTKIANKFIIGLLSQQTG